MLEPNVLAISETLLPDATRRLIRSADGLPDQAYDEASGLPGWSRAHVLAHLTLNAEGLAAALVGIVTGKRLPMYASQEVRDGDIARLAGRGASVVRTRLLGACTDLTDALDAVPDDQWDTTIERVPGGRIFAASDVPGMRLREVEIHHADLAAGYRPGDWPPEVAANVLDAMLTRGAASSSFQACATDLGRTWSFGVGGPTVTGSGAALAWWLTGRGTGEGLTSEPGELPRIGAW